MTLTPREKRLAARRRLQRTVFALMREYGMTEAEALETPLPKALLMLDHLREKDERRAPPSLTKEMQTSWEAAAKRAQMRVATGVGR